jgi:outer membrane protein OmpA-like peptidoglycan-associated protein
MRFRALAGPLLLLLLLPTLAAAAEGFNSHLLHVSPFGGRYLTFEDAQTMAQWRWGLGALIDYAHAPVEVRTENERVTGVVDNLLTTDLFGAFSPHEIVDVGLHIPIHWYNRSRSFNDLGDADGVTDRQNRTSMGDMRLSTKVRILEEGIWPFGVAVTPFVTLPTGDAKAMLGDGRVTGGLTGSYEIDLAWVRMGLAGGWRYRGGSSVIGTPVRNAYPLALGISRDVTDLINLSLEMHGELYETNNNRDFAGNPLELDLVGRYQFTKDLAFLGGGGPGLTSGVGSPDFRLFAGVFYRPIKEAVPPPSTGNLRVVVQDKHGNPLEAEVGLEGAELRLGNTTDGTFAVTDLAPGTYQVRVSRSDYETGVTEAVIYAGQTATATVVLYQLETRLSIIVLDKDKGHRLGGTIIFNPGTPDERIVENPAGELSEEAAPGPVTFTAMAPSYEAVMTGAEVTEHQTTTVTVRLRRKIEKAGRIFFDLDSDQIRPESKSVLADVAGQIKALAPKAVVIEGHSSDEGTDEYNLKLSQRRADAVRKFLVGQGVGAAVLRTETFGESRPIASNESEEGRERNRRVEFIIEEE